MKKIILFLFLIVAFQVNGEDLENKYNTIPQPQKIIKRNGSFTINSQTIIITDNSKEFIKIVNQFIERFKNVAGISLKLTYDNNKKINNAIYFLTKEGMGLEEYHLDINKDHIIIESSYPNGAFYALQTLYQLLPSQIFGNQQVNDIKWEVPAVAINDFPRFSYRGMHLDVTSHFMPAEFIKRYLDLMAIYKFNVFHWHLTDDQGWRIEIKKYPKLTEYGSIRKETVIGTYKSNIYDGLPYGGFYTQNEVKEIIKYASDRFITIIPEIEMPGHALAAIACYPNLSCGLEEKYEVGTRWGIYKEVYCPKEETFEFLENVLTEIMELFPSKYIHIGGDECPKDSWKKCPYCQALIKKEGLRDEFELQSYFIRRVEKFVNSKGRQIIGWDEILQGGLAPNATVMSWLGEEGGIKAAQQHHDVIMCPHIKYYLDYYQADPEWENLCMGHLVPLHEVYDYEPVPDTLNLVERSYIKGIQGCVWTEYMTTPQRIEYMAFPRALAISESAWSNKDNKNWYDFANRLEKHFECLDQLKVNYCKAFYDVSINLSPDGPYSKIAILDINSPQTKIYYTLDGLVPNEQSTLYTLPFVINKSAKISAIGIRNGKTVGKVTYKWWR